MANIGERQELAVLNRLRRFSHQHSIHNDRRAGGQIVRSKLMFRRNPRMQKIF